MNQPKGLPQICFAVYTLHEAEFNLGKMVKESIIKAYRRYPLASNESIADALGISVRSLYRALHHFNIDYKQIRSEHIKRLKNL